MEKQTNVPGWYNKATRAVVSTLGVVFGIGGIGHGIFEALQGSAPTGGFVIHAIGEAHRMWSHGYEPAFTVLPTFLLTGIAAIVVSLAVIIWSIGHIHRKNGPLVFLLLFVLLFLVGGGIGQVIFFILGWAFAICIRKPLTMWKKIIPESQRSWLAKLWPAALPVGALAILFALEIAMFGMVPGIRNQDRVLTIMLTSLGTGLVLLVVSFISALAHDIRRMVF